MKEERLSILHMLEKGIITAQEAERLLLALNGTQKVEQREGVNDVVNNALNKAGGALNAFAKTVGKQAEKLEPKVRDMAEKVTEKASTLADDARTYAEKLREKKAKQKQEDLDSCFEEEMSTEPEQSNATSDETLSQEEEKQQNITEDLQTQQEEEPSHYLKNLGQYMDHMQSQLQQIDDAEAFLKDTFGEADWQDEQEDKTEEEKKEQ